ncbi:hypothetical protein [Streptomyces sp. NPDC049744]|uniref:hypothetical protein n=1 Tax=Streptomyces sp. NPDC049744 TaxID=3154359 RepID=UPI00341C963A
MNATLRRIAVSTTATVALLGGAAATADAATVEQEATILAIARTDTEPGSADGITNGLTPDNSGTGAQLTNPQQQAPAGAQQQYQTQASGGAIGAGVVAILLLGTVVFFRVKGGHMKAGDAVVVSLLGIALAGTVVGAMGDQLTNSVVGSLGGVLGGL